MGAAGGPGKTIEYLKILGLHNPADMLTKHLAEEPRSRGAEAVSIRYLPGRPKIAPELCSDELNALEAPSPTQQPPRVKPQSLSGKGTGSTKESVVKPLFNSKVSWADLDEHGQEAKDDHF